MMVGIFEKCTLNATETVENLVFLYPIVKVHQKTNLGTERDKMAFSVF
jgi:hypothetical protein